jgi:rare lipoprotein A
MCVLLGVCGLLVACIAPGQTTRSKPTHSGAERDGPPKQVPTDLSTLPDPVPRPEPRSKYGNPATYTVAGKTYRVMPSSRGYAETGKASWYGTKFHGRRTSSGEPYDMLQLTAAHKTLPIPTYAHVTNLDNGRRSIVRINDRGPFHPERIIDLSYAAAVKLGVNGTGTANVRVEAISFDQPRRAERYTLQAGAFAMLAAADALQVRLKALLGYPVLVVQTPDDHLYRVRVGPIEGDAALDQVRAIFDQHQLGRPVLIEGS